jgi:hypothetical protein
VEICATVVSTFKSKNNNVFCESGKEISQYCFHCYRLGEKYSEFQFFAREGVHGKKICVSVQVTLREGFMQINLINEKQVIVLCEGF